MTQDQLKRAKSAGRLPYYVNNSGRMHWTLGSSLKQVQAKFRGWTVQKVNWDEFEFMRLE